MKRMAVLSIALGAVALAASAQEDDAIRKLKFEAEQTLAQIRTTVPVTVTEQGETRTEQLQTIVKTIIESKVVGLAGAAMGETVKGAPYTGTEVVETTQVLGDGTRIHNERQTAVYRDSEGRVRRETPDQVTIWDPVANVSYILDPKGQSARRVRISRNFVYSSSGSHAGAAHDRTVEVRSNEGGITSVTVDGKPADPATVKLEHQTADVLPLPSGLKVASHFETSGESESLGKQTMEGLVAEGTRTTRTIEAGAIGNDRPIRIVEERWISSDLKTAVMTRHSDPRSGEETFRLVNVNRAEPAAYLFQVPAGYQEK